MDNTKELSNKIECLLSCSLWLKFLYNLGMFIEFLLDNIFVVTLLLIEFVLLIVIAVVSYIKRERKLFKICLVLLFVEVVLMVCFSFKISSLS